MKVELEHISVAMILIGATVAVSGTLSETGIWDIGLTASAAYAGAIAIIVGVVLSSISMRMNAGILDDILEMERCDRILSKLPDDDYCADLYSEEEWWKRAPKGGPEIIDMTEWTE